MKNIKYLLFVVLTFFATTLSVNASEITKATYDGTFKIEGTGSGQIQVALFDLDNKPIYFTTVNASDGKFSITFPKIEGLEKGNYKVKVADYDGKNAVSKEVAVTEIKTPKNPGTYDGILIYVIIGLMSIVGLSGATIYIKKRKIN